MADLQSLTSWHGHVLSVKKHCFHFCRAISKPFTSYRNGLLQLQYRKRTLKFLFFFKHQDIIAFILFEKAHDLIEMIDLLVIV